MSKQGKSRAPLVVGIVAAVVILLALVLALLLFSCGGMLGFGSGSETTAPTETVPTVPEYVLYWNLDRAEYDGKSEAGMSSRQPESDGYFHVRFFVEGEIVDLKVADRKTINAIDVNDLMGLEFDEDGIVVGVTSIDDMPLDQVGWQFYVQSIGGKILKLNSSKAFNGLEVILDITENTGIWDMTGMEGEVGMPITPIGGDRVIAIANLAGELTHVYVYDRPEYMQSFTAYCQHCEKDAEWKMWTKENELPGNTGHYQLQNNISGMSKQQYINEDQKVCLDLNGMTVDGKDNARVYTLHYTGAHLAIMDNSEEQKGVLRGHSTASDQGGVVWVRYGQFHLYSGTLDGSDMVCKLNGAAIDIPKGAYFYMHGGKIIGGTAKAVKNDKGNWTNGLGGTMVVRGKFVMNGGVIEGGKATGVVTKYAADGTPSTYSRGIGGNIYVGSGGVVEINDGTIKNGTATHSGGNIYVDGTGELTMNGGIISGGKVTGKGRNGGNVFITSKSTFTFNGGSISYGSSYNCAANLYLNGKVIMNGGYIGKGTIYKWGTREKNLTSNSINVFNVNGNFQMYGGKIDGSVLATDTVADKTKTQVVLSGYATILAPEGAQYPSLTLNTGGDNITCRVGTLRDSAKIGVIASTGIFTLPTKEENVDNFISEVDDAQICYVDGCLGLGRMGGCECGVKSENAEDHLGTCTGEQLFWAPIPSTTMPKVTGNYYVPRVQDENGDLVTRTINCKEQSSMVENAVIHLDLNGNTLKAKENYRFFSLHNPGTVLTICDSSDAKTGTVITHGEGTTQGNAIWVRYGEFTLYSGTLDGSKYFLTTSWNVGADAIPGTADDKTDARDGGTVAMGTGTTFNMYGGTIIGNKQGAVTLTKTYKETTTETQIVDGKETEVEVVVTTEHTRDMTSANGASLSVAKNGVFNMYGGIIRDGITEGNGGNIYASSSAKVNLYGGTIRDGKAGPYAPDGKTKVGWGGNINIRDTAVLTLDGAEIIGGISGGNGGSVYAGGGTTINMISGSITGGESKLDQAGNLFIGGTANLTGGVISGGKSVNGGNIAINSGKDNIFSGVTIKDGTATKAGGNVIINTTHATGLNTFGAGTVISGGNAGTTGGNLYMAPNNANKNNPNARAIIDGAVIKDGTSVGNGPNIYAATSGTGVTELTVNSGSITGGKTVGGGGGIYAIGATASVTINGGTIADNVARWGGNIYLDKAPLVINDGTISGGSTYDNGSGASGNGGNIYSAGAPITLNGGTVTGGKTGDFGGNVWTNNTFTMNGGVISNGEAKASSGKGGGNLFTNNANGKFYLNGGEVKDGVAGKGGNIMLSNAGAICVIDGATVTGGQTTASHGGNINVAAGTLTLKSGTISNGVSKDSAGNIYNNGGTVIIEGGKVLGGTDKNGANGDYSNIFIVCAAIELRGGEMDGGVYVYNYKNDNASIKMSGAPVIKSETRNGLRIHYSDGATKIPFIQIDAPMTEGAEVYIHNTNWGTGKFTTPTEEEYAKYFHPDDETRTIGYVDQCIALGKTNCVCGAPEGEHYGACTGEQLFWMPWGSSTSLPTTSGNWYIHPSVTVSLSSQWKPAAGAVINLDLNGRTVTCGARAVALNNAGVNVTVTDLSADRAGKIFKTGTYTGQGGLVWVTAGSTFTLYDGTIDGTGYVNGSNGGAVCVEGASFFNMYGGTIKGTTSKTNGGNVAVKNTSVMTMTGGTIEGGKAFETGGNLFVTGDAKVYISGGKILDGVAGKDYVTDATKNGWGGNIELAGNGYLKLSGDAEISGGKTTGNGGNIRISSPTAVMEMTGGTVKNGETNDNGGNIFVNGALTVTGGTIKDGKAKNGGNISANTAKTVSLSNITISGGEATTGQGGNVRVFNNAAATLNLNNVTLTGGKAPASKMATANLDVTVACTANITDTQIDGYAQFSNSAATVNLSGKVTVTGGETNLTLIGAKLTIQELAEDSMVGITATGESGVFTNETEEKYVANFTSDDPDLTVDYVDGKMVLSLGRYYCLCGSTNGTHALGCDGTVHFWTPWNSSTSLPSESGYWYLTKDVVTLTGQVKITTAQDIYLDLNGKTVKNAEGSNIRFYWINADDCHVTVTDTVGGGNMTNNGTYTQGMIAWISIGGATKDPSFTLIKGKLDVSGASAGNFAVAPNAICLGSADCIFNMYGGELLGGKTVNGGGAVYGENWDSRFNLYGGTVTGHPEEEHAAVRLMGTKNVISGGTITGGVELNSVRFDAETSKSASQLTLSGSPSIDSILLTDVNDVRTTAGNYTILPLITVSGKLGNTKAIALSVLGDANHVFTANVVDAANASKFTPATAGQSVLVVEEGTNAGKLYIGATKCLCGATDGNHTSYTNAEGELIGCDGTPKPWMAWTSTSSLPTATGYWYLTENVAYTGQASLSKNANVILDLNGKTVQAAQVDGADANTRVYSIHNPGAKLTITDSVGGGKMIASATKNDTGNVAWVRRDATWEADDNIGTFILLGGELIGNNPNCTKNGAVVAVGSYGSFYMLGGTITGGTAKYGGNLFVDDMAEAYLVAGEITDGTAMNGHGGNICADPNSTLIMYKDMTVSGGSAQRESAEGGEGGNIKVYGTFIMEGGTVKDGVAGPYVLSDGTTKTGWGGNIHGHSASSITIKGGTISGGQAGGNGGSINANKSLTISGGTISGGESKLDRGGNIWMGGSATLTITGGTISGGKVGGDRGGNIHANANAVLNITGGTISGGTVKGSASNISANINWEGGTGKVTIGGTANIAGGVYIRNASTVIEVSGKPVISGGSTNLTPVNKITVGALESGANIGINRDPGVFTTNTVDASYASYFTSDKTDTGVAYATDGVDKGKLAVGKVYAECGKTEAHDAHDYCDGELHTWLVWSAANTDVPEQDNTNKTGYWYLSADHTVTAGVTIGSGEGGRKVRLNLNGNDIIMQFTGGGASRMYSTNGLGSGTFNLLLTNLSSDPSTIIVDDTNQGEDRGGDQGRIIWMTQGNVKTYVNNVDIDLSKAKTDFVNSARESKLGIAFTVGNGRQLHLTDVDITGGTDAQGPVIYVHDAGTAVLHNVTLTNHKGSVDGGGILVNKAAATLTLSGKTKISGCTKLDGTPANITFLEVPTFTLTETYVDCDQGIDAPVNTVILSEVETGWFVPDDANKVIAYSTEGMLLAAKDAANVYCVCGSTTGTHAAGCDGTVYVWTALSSINDLKTPGNYYLTESITAPDQIHFAQGETRLNLNGFSITDSSNRLFTTSGATNAIVTVTDTSAGKNGALVVDHTNLASVYNGQGVGFWLAGQGCELNWLAGTLDVTKASTNNYGGVAVYVEGGTTFNLYGGTIKGGRAILGGTNYPTGGSVKIVAGGTMNMHGGTVTDGIGDGVHGGNISVYGVLNLFGGTITKGQAIKNNATNGHGANIAILDAGVVNLSGGSVVNGNAVQWGGNIYMYPTGGKTSVLNMTGGTIKNGAINDSTANMSANITMRGGAVINMSGGVIEGRITGASTGTKTLNLSGSAKIPGNISGVNGNNVSVAVTVNIGKVNEDAIIGFQYSAPSSTATDAETLLTNNKLFLANINDPDSYKVSMSGFSAYLAGDKYKRTYELFVENGKLYVQQVSKTLK